MERGEVHPEAPDAAPGGPGPVDPGSDAEPLSPGRLTARILAVLVAVAIGALWIYALWGPTKREPPGLLSDPTFAIQAQQVCTETATVISALPPAYESPDAGARAEVVALTNAELVTMLGRLVAIAPPASAGNDGRMIQEWLGDWSTYLNDRQRYVEALASDPGARFYVTEKESRQITEPIDFFATHNEMRNCVTPGDLA